MDSSIETQTSTSTVTASASLPTASSKSPTPQSSGSVTQPEWPCFVYVPISRQDDSESEYEPSKARSACISRCLTVIFIVFLLIFVALLGGLIGHVMTRPNCSPELHLDSVAPGVENNFYDRINVPWGFLNESTPVVPDLPYIEGNGTKIVRLPLNLQPIHYEISLQLRHGISINGTISILINCTEKTEKILLNAHRMDIEVLGIFEVLNVFDSADSSEFSLTNVKFDEKLQILEISVRPQLEKGRVYNLTLRHFFDEICEDHGLECHPGDPAQFATRFEPMAARRVFPSFDEPNFKATFSIRIIYEPRQNLTVLSNEKICNRISNGKMIEDQFCTTPKMSTYLVTVVVYVFATRCEKSRQTNLPICIHASPRFEGNLQDSIQIIVERFDQLQDYFVVNYPLSKLDIVGVEK